MIDGNELLMSSGKAPPSLDFGKTPGVTRWGTIVAGPTSYHAREYDARNPGKGPLKFFDDGNPVLGLWVDLQTSESLFPDDTGIRRLYVEKRRMKEAIRDAVLAAGADRLEKGGLLSVTWTGEEPSQGGMPATTWTARYQTPGGAALMAQGQQPQTLSPQPPPGGYGPAGQLPPQQPVQQFAPTVAGGGLPAEAFARYTAAATMRQSAPPIAPAPPAAPAAPIPSAPTAGNPQMVPQSVYDAMRNAGFDVNAFAPIPGT